MALDPLGTESIRTDVDGDAEMVSRKADRLDALLVVLLQQPDVQEAHILEVQEVSVIVAERVDAPACSDDNAQVAESVFDCR